MLVFTLNFTTYLECLYGSGEPFSPLFNNEKAKWQKEFAR